jgi:hypothetical protein
MLVSIPGVYLTTFTNMQWVQPLLGHTQQFVHTGWCNGQLRIYFRVGGILLMDTGHKDTGHKALMPGVWGLKLAEKSQIN